MRTVGLEYIQGHYWPYSFCGTKSIQEKKMDLGELATNFGPQRSSLVYTWHVLYTCKPLLLRQFMLNIVHCFTFIASTHKPKMAFLSIFHLQPVKTDTRVKSPTKCCYKQC